MAVCTAPGGIATPITLGWPRDATVTNKIEAADCWELLGKQRCFLLKQRYWCSNTVVISGVTPVILLLWGPGQYPETGRAGREKGCRSLLMLSSYACPGQPNSGIVRKLGFIEKPVPDTIIILFMALDTCEERWTVSSSSPSITIFSLLPVPQPLTRRPAWSSRQNIWVRMITPRSTFQPHCYLIRI